ncbi:MAG: hypothetical protein L0322_06575 [Chloroflexi bacterium]|nr:hypothetical protein [Chloroflexota bacterium]MCI0580623.1 hypothetical protein [Chloroflexota bacterium]MCI0647635.1 hypothetical protein [Chloroflexota bacterium]
MRKQLKWYWIFGLIATALVACEQTPTPVPATPSSLPATSEAAASPTTTTLASPTAGVTPEATATAVPASPTAAPTTPAPTRTLPPTPTQFATPIPTVGPIAPGQEDSAALEVGGFKSYVFGGVRFRPALIFVEGDSALDVAISVYEGALPANTDLSTQTPLAEADTNITGGPEIMVFTPETDGDYTLVVSGRASTAGAYTLYFYNGTTAAPNAQVSADSLAAGEVKSYTVQSNGGRPVIVFVDQTDQSDLAIQVTDASGAVVNTADFGGQSSAEALFMLPLQTTVYTVRISETTGAVASYDLVMVTLD